MKQNSSTVLLVSEVVWERIMVWSVTDCDMFPSLSLSLFKIITNKICFAHFQERKENSADAIDSLPHSTPLPPFQWNMSLERASSTASGIPPPPCLFLFLFFLSPLLSPRPPEWVTTENLSSNRVIGWGDKHIKQGFPMQSKWQLSWQFTHEFLRFPKRLAV